MELGERALYMWNVASVQCLYEHFQSVNLHVLPSAAPDEGPGVPRFGAKSFREDPKEWNALRRSEATTTVHSPRGRRIAGIPKFVSTQEVQYLVLSLQ